MGAIWRVVALMQSRDQRGATGRPTHDDALSHEVPGEYGPFFETVARTTYDELCRTLRFSRAEYRVALYRGDALVEETMTTYDDRGGSERTRLVAEYLEAVRECWRRGLPAFLCAESIATSEARFDGRRMILDEARVRACLSPDAIQRRLGELVESALARLCPSARNAKRAA